MGSDSETKAGHQKLHLCVCVKGVYCGRKDSFEYQTTTRSTVLRCALLTCKKFQHGIRRIPGVLRILPMPRPFGARGRVLSAITSLIAGFA